MKKILFSLTAIVFTFKVISQTFPAGFSQVQIGGTIWYPTSMAFAPDGRIFVTEKDGKIRIIKNGAILSTNFYQVAVDNTNERGLGSIALDPNFSSNNYVYIYYTTQAPIHNRLSRITANGDVAVPGSEITIYDFDASVGSIHNGGGMAFGSDGTLYLAVGNDNVNANSQDLDVYKGKLLRINPDFSIPSGNPYTSGSEAKKRIWAYGFRNPWTLDIQPGTGKLFVNDVGEGTWEEINDATIAGKNFGWPGSQGNTTNPAYTSPVYAYRHDPAVNGGCAAITGGAFFNPTSTNYPAQYTGKYFFIDYCNDWIDYIDPSNGQKSNFASNLPGSGNYLKVGNDGNLYYFSIGGRSLYKIIYSGSNIPAITTHPTNVSVPLGQQASFTVTASGATPLTYQWKKGGINIAGAPNSPTYIINSVQAADAGQYSVDVSNSYGNALSNSATLTVTAANSKPTATIISPLTGATYRNGDVINFSGNGTDPEDGTLPASAFEWIVEFHHNIHYHPGPSITPGTKSGSFSTIFGETSADVFFRLILGVSDAQGQKSYDTLDIHPVTSSIYLASQPSGREIKLADQSYVTPDTVLAVSGMTLNLDIKTPQITTDYTYVFDHWLQGGSASQIYTVNDNNVTLTAVFNSTINSIPVFPDPSPDIQIFPNPSNGQFTLVLNTGASQQKKIKMTILNPMGQKVYEQDYMVKNTGIVKEFIKLDNTLPPGNYTLQLMSDNNMIHTNIVVLTK